MLNQTLNISKAGILSASLAIIVPLAGYADIINWNNNPLNYENSELNHQNNSLNYYNSPLNFQNNPMNYNSNRIVRDNEGDAIGYAVPKPDGGANYFDLKGNRKGYQGPDSRR